MNKISHVTSRWVSKRVKINQSPLSFIQIPRFMPSLASKYILNKANLRNLIAAPGLIILVKLDSNRRFFTPCDLEIWWMTPHNKHLFYTTSSFVHHFKSISDSYWSYSPETLCAGQNWRFFVPCDLEIWRMTLKNNRTPLQWYCKLFVPFHNHWWT